MFYSVLRAVAGLPEDPKSFLTVSANVCIYICIYPGAHAYIYNTYTHMYMYVCMYTYMYKRVKGYVLGVREAHLMLADQIP